MFTTPISVACSLYREEQIVRDEAALTALLQQRDRQGGGEFWLASPDEEYPRLALVVSGEHWDVHYFSTEGGDFFRCLRPPGEPPLPDDYTLFVWDGCDPGDGQWFPNEFVFPFSTAFAVALEFCRCPDSLPRAAEWFEL